MSSTLKIISDIHLEFHGAREALPNIVPNTDAIGLLGDIGNPLKPAYAEFLFEMSDKFSQVFVIAGNHEYYANEFSFTNMLIEQICNKRENLHFLNNTSFDWGNIRVLGGTLWSNAPKELYDEIKISSTDHAKIITHISEEYQLNEKLIENIDLGQHWDKLQIYGTKFSVEEKVKLHEEHVSWLKKEIELAKNENKNVIILTHHAPTSKLCLPWQVKNNYAYELDSCTNLEDLFDDNVLLWGFGHTHYNCDQIIKNTRVVSNQLGYVRRTNPTFDGSLSLDISKNALDLNEIVVNRQKTIETTQLILDKEAEEKYLATNKVSATVEKEKESVSKCLIS